MTPLGEGLVTRSATSRHAYLPVNWGQPDDRQRPREVARTGPTCVGGTPTVGREPVGS